MKKPFRGYEEPEVALAELATAAEDFLHAYGNTEEIKNHKVGNPVANTLLTLEMSLNFYKRCSYAKG